MFYTITGVLFCPKVEVGQREMDGASHGIVLLQLEEVKLLVVAPQLSGRSDPFWHSKRRLQLCPFQRQTALTLSWHRGVESLTNLLRSRLVK